jgi:hypothetical protein
MGMLVQRLREEQREARRQFEGVFKEFAKRRNRRGLRHLVKRQPGDPPLPSAAGDGSGEELAAGEGEK